MPTTVACFEGGLEETKRVSEGNKEKRILRQLENSAFWDSAIFSVEGQLPKRKRTAIIMR